MGEAGLGRGSGDVEEGSIAGARSSSGRPGFGARVLVKQQLSEGTFNWEQASRQTKHVPGS